MLTLPENIEREPQAYAYMTFTVRMDQMQLPAQEGFPALFGYLAELGIEPVGAAFYNYRRINMAETLDVEAGVAVARTGPDSDRIKFGTLPGGRFVTLTWHGHPDKLEPVTGMLIGWLRLTQQPLDMEERADGDHFACRLEIYQTDPDEEPDMDKWVTDLAFKLKD
ncbi:GyrI-like domain-containing protein [Devosia ginsengisoli]|uniref:GyrI-like domain-containing protein n=1 Tax=Devosia ginsengisoli TaxID=400770 RepID=UPI0026F189E4|nr:GyrI-like domain-containing protein [Devosia ginsengisoli]MCR6672698.1 GyrI-like domain-containing protein [Devosia ginsengisoli]